MDDFDYGAAQWDLIVATYEGAASREKAARALKPAGVLVMEGFLRGPRTPPRASFGPNELLKFLVDLNLRILRYEDVEAKPDWARHNGRVVRVCARKPE